MLDSNKMFYRLLTSAMFKKDTKTLEETLKLELVTYPPSLFESEELLLSSTKSLLDKSIREKTGINAEEEPDNHSYPNIMYIVDGGMLIHTIKWAKGSTFEEIGFSYYTWIAKYHYQKVTVVFDGYQPSTKDMCHHKRTKDSCCNIIPSLDSKLVVAKDKFLCNLENKERFLYLL